MFDVGFYVVAAALVGSALMVVLSRNLVHAVLWLGLSLLITALIYVLLDAPFLAGVQVLTYVGGVVTLMIFGVMLTRRQADASAVTGHDGVPLGLAVSVAVFAVVARAIMTTKLDQLTAAKAPTTASIAENLLDRYLLPFEVASVLLLAAIIGAVVIARRKDHEPGVEKVFAPTIDGSSSISAREVGS